MKSKIILLLTFFLLISCSNSETEFEHEVIEQKSSSDVITIPVNDSQPNF